MAEFRKQKVLPSKFQKKKKKKKKSKDRCFIVEKFQIINIGEAVKIYQYFQNLFRNLDVFCRNFDESHLKVEKIKMSEFQKMYVRRPGNHKHSFSIT